jgi:4-hydroxy-3-methylbut-2-en-1-yl diphosphate reductase
MGIFYLKIKTIAKDILVAPKDNCLYNINMTADSEKIHKHKKTLMRINIAKAAGFCFGVKRALKIASEAARSTDKTYMLGNLVHNEMVIGDIKKMGIRKIKRLRPAKNKRNLLIRAHGASKRTYKEAKNCGYKIIDATCPMVREIHDIARQWERKGYTIVIIGDKEHDEVLGISGQLRTKALIIDYPRNIPKAKVSKIKKAAIITQSTQKLENTLEITRRLEKHIPQVKFFNTICQPTRQKQKEIQIMPVKNDIILIIGSKTSANTRRLYEISRSLNKNTYWIQSKEDLRKIWFKNKKSLGITAGASTPQKSINEVLSEIKKISKKESKVS